jgi:hypothetical protein
MFKGISQCVPTVSVLYFGPLNPFLFSPFPLCFPPLFFNHNLYLLIFSLISWLSSLIHSVVLVYFLRIHWSLKKIPILSSSYSISFTSIYVLSVGRGLKTFGGVILPWFFFRFPLFLCWDFCFLWDGYLFHFHVFFFFLGISLFLMCSGHQIVVKCWKYFLLDIVM